jgi:three-Cys-motif partner protein
MATRKRAKSRGRAHGFGGDWTSAKLGVLAKYLAAYTTALKDKPSAAHPFRKAYIDAFAGTGYRSMQRDGDASTNLLFPDLADTAPQELLDGSARLALKTQPPFDRYIFIERNAARCTQLNALKSEFPELAANVRVEQGEANEEIRKICDKDWRAHRAVLFLDPYGMQVEWQTIEAIAKTEAIDLWLLFPLGIGVARLLTRSGDIPAGWRRRLDKLLGTRDWYDEFYRVEHTPTLFGTDEERVVKATNDTIGRYFNDRLKSVFPGVADPGVLRNSSNCPLYLLCFAAGNEKGAPIALKIANHLLKEMR